MPFEHSHSRLLTRVFGFVLIFLLLCILPGCAAPGGTAAAPGPQEEPPESEPVILDVIAFSRDPQAIVALMSDGTLKSAGLGSHFEDSVLAQIFSWRDLVKLVSTGSDLIGLKADGSVVSTIGFRKTPYPLDERFDPNTWTGVRDIAFSVEEYYGLTEDGRILFSNDMPDASFGGGQVYRDWCGIKEILPYAYPESRGLIALCEDGSVKRGSEYYDFTRTPTDAVAIASSGFVTACLNRDGTVSVAGPEVVYVEGFAREANQLQDVEQIAASNNALLCRLKDGTVAVCDGDVLPLFAAVSDWRDMVDIQMMRMLLIGLRADGRVLCAPSFEGADYDRELIDALAGWEDIVRIRVHDGGEYFPSCILGWQSDGTLLAAGIDLSLLG